MTSFSWSHSFASFQYSSIKSSTLSGAARELATINIDFMRVIEWMQSTVANALESPPRAHYWNRWTKKSKKILSDIGEGGSLQRTKEVKSNRLTNPWKTLLSKIGHLFQPIGLLHFLGIDLICPLLPLSLSTTSPLATQTRLKNQQRPF